MLKSKVSLSVTATLLLDSVKSLNKDPKASPIIFLSKMLDSQIPESEASERVACEPKAIV